MKQLSVVIVLAGIGYLAWTLLGAESDAVRCYKEFAEAWADQRFDAALELTAEGSEARRMVASRIAREQRKGTSTGVTYGVTGLAFDVTSERTAGDGRTVSLRAQQTTRITGAGQEPAFGRPVLAEHEVELRAEGTAWKVMSFQERHP